MLLILIAAGNLSVILEGVPEVYLDSEKEEELFNYVLTYFFGNLLFIVLGELYEKKVKRMHSLLPNASIIFSGLESTGLYAALTDPEKVTPIQHACADLM